MSKLISTVRNILIAENKNQINVNELLKKVPRHDAYFMKLKKENLMETLEYYKKLSVIYMDENENVIFL